MIQKWKKKSSKYITENVVFKLRCDVISSPRTGKDLDAYILETRDWVNIVPVTPDNQIVMVRQYRFAAEEVTLEIPGGLLDMTGESFANAARRELCEETGYDSDEIIPLGTVKPNPAILTNHLHIFAAKNVTLLKEQELDDGEDIQVELVSFEKIPSLIHDGTISHALVLNAFYLYDLHTRNHQPD